MRPLYLILLLLPGPLGADSPPPLSDWVLGIRLNMAGVTGLPYLIAQKIGLRSGFYIAWVPEKTVFDIQVGPAWH